MTRICALSFVALLHTAALAQDANRPFVAVPPTDAEVWVFACRQVHSRLIRRTPANDCALGPDAIYSDGRSRWHPSVLALIEASLPDARATTEGFREGYAEQLNRAYLALRHKGNGEAEAMWIVAERYGLPMAGIKLWPDAR